MRWFHCGNRWWWGFCRKFVLACSPWKLASYVINYAMPCPHRKYILKILCGTGFFNFYMMNFHHDTWVVGSCVWHKNEEQLCFIGAEVLLDSFAKLFDSWFGASIRTTTVSCSPCCFFVILRITQFHDSLHDQFHQIIYSFVCWRETLWQMPNVRV